MGVKISLFKIRILFPEKPNHIEFSAPKQFTPVF